MTTHIRLLIAFRSLINHMTFTETSITEYVNKSFRNSFADDVSTVFCKNYGRLDICSTCLRTFDNGLALRSGYFLASALVTAVLQHCIQRALDIEGGSGLAHIDRLLLSLIFHCSKGHNHSTSMQEIGNVLTCAFTLALIIKMLKETT